MSVIWRKVWFDLWGNKVRTILAVLSIAIGVFAIGAVFGMVDQLMTGMDTAHQAVIPSHIFMALQERIDRDTANLDYQYNLSAVLVWLLIILIISSLASILPARNATLVSVRDSLAYV
jgi:ABC-type lipoprotein release transport system permease subunit